MRKEENKIGNRIYSEKHIWTQESLGERERERDYFFEEEFSEI